MQAKAIKQGSAVSVPFRPNELPLIYKLDWQIAAPVNHSAVRHHSKSLHWSSRVASQPNAMHTAWPAGGASCCHVLNGMRHLQDLSAASDDTVITRGVIDGSQLAVRSIPNVIMRLYNIPVTYMFMTFV